MDKYIGFDVSDKQTIACLVQRGRKDRYQTLPTEPGAMKSWLRRQRGRGDRLHLTFEVCGMAAWLYDELRDSVDTLTVSNPSQLTWIYRTTKKSDRIDARKQAVLLQLGEIPAVHLPSPAVRQWRADIRHRARLIHSRTQLKNRLRSHLKSRGYRQPTVSRGWWTQKHLKWLRDRYAADVVIQDGLDHLALLDRQIRRTTDRLDERLQDHAGGHLLRTIPGVGPRTVEAVLAYTDRIERFGRGKDFASYFGLTPKLDQSGAQCRWGHISKRGPAVARWVLVEAAWKAIRHSASLQMFFNRVKRGQPKRNKIAIVAVARKLLEIMRAMLLSGEVFNETLVLQQGQPKRADRSVLLAFYN